MSFTSLDESGFLQIEAKRLKSDPRTYSNSRKHEKYRFRRNRSEGSLPGTSKISYHRREKPTGPPVCILDNGGYSAKIGFSTSENANVIPNCIMKVKSERKRFFIGNQIEECRDLSGLYYLLPCEKGYITKWNVQKPVWDYMFNNICPIEDNPVIMTQPLFNFKPIQEVIDEIFFEEYEVKSLYRTNSVDLAKYEYVANVVGRESSCIIVDSGFSFTHIVPYIKSKKFYKAMKRIDVGGKLLTNYLKDIISYRQLHVMDETYVINQVKEDTCFVSLDFKEDMKIAGYQGDRNTIVKNYVLPDFNTIRRGYVQKPGETAADIAEGCQILRLNNERFTVPEILFYPSDINMEMMGITETIVKCIKLCPSHEQPALAKNIVIIGGNANFPGFQERVQADVRSHLPDHWTVNVYKPKDPTTFAWLGGKSLSSDPAIKSLIITKEQYEECGSTYTYERFSDWVGSQTYDDTESNAASDSCHPTEESILLSGNFSRFDLFGKYEKEMEEVHVVDEDVTEKTQEAENADSDVLKSNVTADLSSSNQNDIVENDQQSSSSSADSAQSNGSELSKNAMQDELNKTNEKLLSKNLNKAGNEPDTNENPDYVINDILDTYDFNLMNFGYI